MACCGVQSALSPIPRVLEGGCQSLFFQQIDQKPSPLLIQKIQNVCRWNYSAIPELSLFSYAQRHAAVVGIETTHTWLNQKIIIIMLLPSHVQARVCETVSVRQIMINSLCCIKKVQAHYLSTQHSSNRIKGIKLDKTEFQNCILVKVSCNNVLREVLCTVSPHGHDVCKPKKLNLQCIPLVKKLTILPLPIPVW